MTTYLVRHGQSLWNELHRTQGQTAHPALTEMGHQHAAAAAETVAADLARTGVSATLLLCSDLTRAVQTAEIIGSRLSLEPLPDPRLREQALGCLEGRDNADALAAVADVDWSDPDVAIGGGESGRQVFDRMADVLGSIIDADAVVVSHGDALRYALGWLAGFDAGCCPWQEIGPGAVFTVERGGSPRRLDLVSEGRDRRL